ncbi:ion transporter [Pseudonocardia sp. DSM 110487]|jgi:voltage-gated potassium channel|uniref:potassium channel family protein n=1 Tax=Pseudonocardia sp. DSM 110487 TaxID=2865833 RepID=UPI001C6965CF|nr:potassium channel family protein [Pseudonocardia sp. DSM 110487]QYN36183.1 ion transporter [Pseudonocardia sp. DSM 110487]
MASPDLAVEPRIAAWDRRVDWWLTGLAGLFLAAYAWQVLDTSLTPAGRNALEVVLTGTWVLFALDYLVRIALAHRRWHFVRTHLLDLVILALPMFRQLRVLRLITVVSVLNRQLRDDARGRVVFYVAGTVALVGFVASIAVLDAERYAPDASITTFGDAVWWTMTTISTVGYGDRYPVTPEGRLVAVSLMVAGIALLGVVTASIASWFVENLRRSRAAVERELDEVSADVIRAEEQLAAVLAELRAINARLDELERSSRPS